MATWQIIRPQAATNLVANPSAETGTTGWAVYAGVGTLTRQTAHSAYGIYALYYAINIGLPYPQGAYYTVSLSATTGYYASVYLYHQNTTARTMQLRVRTGGVTIASVTVSVTGQLLTRVVLPFTSTVGGVYTLEVLQAAAVSGSQAFYFDAAQISTTNANYLDGDQPGANWYGTPHASASYRLATTRDGGVVVNLENEYGFYLTRELNTDELGHDYLEQDIPFEPGTRATGLKVQRRVWGLTGQLRAATPEDLAAQKNALIHDTAPLLVPRVNNVPQPVRWQRVGTYRTLEIAGHYAGGLEGNYDAVFECKEDIALQIISQSPYWYQVTQDGATLDANDAQVYTFLAARRAGIWQNITVNAIAGAGISYAQAWGPDGQLYVGGDFQQIDGLVGGDYIGRYDPFSDTWSALATGLNGIVYALAFAPNGTLYVGGAFTAAGGDVNANYVAQWNGTAFSALTANPLDAAVYALAFYPPTGGLVLGGLFTQDSVPTALNYIATWTPGGAFTALGAGVSAAVYAVGAQTSGQIIAGGAFADYLRAYNVTDGWYALYNTAAMDAQVNALAVAPDDTVYVGGAFTTLDGETVNRLIAVYTASVSFTGWRALGAGVTGGPVLAISIDHTSDELYISGQFTTASGLDTAPYLVRWTGNGFAPVQTNVPGAPPTAATVIVNPAGDVYFGFGAAGTSERAGYTTVTLPTGASETYPLITIKRAGGTSARLISLWNITTGTRLDFTGFALLDGETIEIDLQAKTVTSDFGRALGSNPVPGSNLRTWYLQAGDNVIGLFVSIAGAPTITARMVYNVNFWSARATEEA